MTNENRIASMDAVGELPEMGNLLLRESGYPHLPDPAFVPAPKSDAWNDAGTKPDHPCLCETRLDEKDSTPYFQKWDGKFFLGISLDKDLANSYSIPSAWQFIQWREVQP